MAVGYRITYHIDSDDGSGQLPELPDHLLYDGSLDESLGRIKELLQTWIESADSNGQPNGRFRQLNIHLFGPFPEEQCVVDRRTPEQRLDNSNTPEERLYALGPAAKSRFEAGEFVDARTLVEELQEMLPSFEGNWNYHNGAATAHLVLGRLALREGDIDGAKRHLIEAACGDGSPTMSSFGPNMSLAHDLLLAGEKQVVLDYFEMCRKFWEMGAEQLDEWAMYVNAGRMPDFGGNQVY